MIITHKIKLDLVRRGCDPIIHMTQSDTNANQIHIRISKDNRPWTPPVGLSAIVHYSNSFGSGGSYDTLANGRPAVTTTQDGIRVTLVPEVTALPGSVHVVVTLLYGGSTLSAFHIQLMIDPLASSNAPVLANYSNIAGFLPVPEVANQGQYLTVGSVDETGHVTSVAAANPPEFSGGSNSSIQLEETPEGVRIHVVNEAGTLTTAQVLHGKDGINGKDGTDGKDGIDGKNGTNGKDGSDGKDGIDGQDGTDGKDGITPHIGTNGNWCIGETDTGVRASGKDGKDGTNGRDGTDGYTPVKGIDYMTYEDQEQMLQSIITQETGKSTSLVMSQKAVTELVSNALGNGGASAEYETVDSVEEMTDTSKTYVLSTTNTLWTYGETEVGTVREQVFDPQDMFAGHMSGANISTGSGQKIYRCPVDMSVIPVDSDVYIDIIGLYPNDGSNTPKLMKIGYSILDTPAVGNNQFSAGGYVQSSILGDGVVTLTSNGCRIKFGYYEGKKISDYNSIKCILLEVMETHTASTISAYLEYDGGVKAAWSDTGIPPSSGGNGGNYVALLVDIGKNTSAIREIENRVIILESGSNTIPVPTFWESAVAACITKIKALQAGRNCITFPFFSDNHTRNGYAGALIAKVMKACHLPYCFYGGDAIASDYIDSEAAMIEQDRMFDTMMSVIPDGRFCPAVGNHDGYWAVSDSDKHYYTREQVYELCIREESLAQNKHLGDDGTYYYVDDIASKVRFIVLNTNGGSVDDAQLAWFRDVALKVDEGWAVVVISHHPISNHYHANISNAAEVRAIVTQSGSEVIGWFSGHIHRDRIYTGAATNTTDDSQGEDMGFTQVVITSDNTGIAYDASTTHTVAEDAQSHAIDFITINRNTRTVNLTRLGIGSDRSYNY